MNELVQASSDIVDGPFGSNLKSSHYVDDGARVVRLQNIGYGSFVPGDAFISHEHFASLVKHEVVEGDLLFASLGADLPRACLAPAFPERAIVKADCIRVRLAPGVNPNFVLLAALRPAAKQWALDKLHGMGRPRLGLGAIRDFPVPIPPLAEQERIVAILEEQLSRLDVVLASIRIVRAKAAQFRRSLLHHTFSRPSASWRVARLDEVARVRAGKTPSKFERRLADEVRSDREVPFFKVGDMNLTGRTMSESRTQFAEDEASVFGLEVLRPGTVVFPKAGGAIATNKKRVLGRPGAIDLNCMAVAAGDQIEDAFLYWFFESVDLSDLVDGTVLPQIGKRKVSEMEIRFPEDRAEQARIVRFLEQHASSLGLALAAADSAEAICAALRRSLLHAAFTGKLTEEWRKTYG